MKKIMAGNWKMYKTAAQAGETAAALASILSNKVPSDREVLILPPFTAIDAVAQAFAGQKGFAVGGQNCYPEHEGAFTGEVSPDMLLDLGCAYVLVGHSERRHVLGESNELCGRKTAFAHQAGLKVILCVGETLAERESGALEKIIAGQLESGLAGLPPSFDPERVAVAYEPVWAIGTGKVAGPEEILQVHKFIRQSLLSLRPAEAAAMRILYGGSVKPDNASRIIGLDNVDGVLVGGASLQADNFSRIVLA